MLSPLEVLMTPPIDDIKAIKWLFFRKKPRYKPVFHPPFLKGGRGDYK
jgi:hypothetical protein